VVVERRSFGAAISPLAATASMQQMLWFSNYSLLTSLILVVFGLSESSFRRGNNVELGL
jgi:hypothetical protein